MSCAICRATLGRISPGSPSANDRVTAAVLNLPRWFDEMYGASGAVKTFPPP